MQVTYTEWIDQASLHGKEVYLQKFPIKYSVLFSGGLLN